MKEKKYIGFIKKEENDDYTIGHYITSNLNKLVTWKQEILTCNNIEECILYELNDIDYKTHIKVKYNNIDIFNKDSLKQIKNKSSIKPINNTKDFHK